MIFALGTLFGSFFNVLLLRINTGESVVSAPSRCFACGARLGVLDLIPILSFLFLRGKCKYCGSKVSAQYPIVEALIGVLAILVYAQISNFQFPISKQFPIFLYYFAVFSALFLVAAYDFKTKIIDSHFLRFFGAFAVIEFTMRNWRAGDWVADAVSALEDGERHPWPAAME